MTNENVVAKETSVSEEPCVLDLILKEIPTKKWYTSKNLWCGVAVFIFNASLIAGVEIPPLAVEIINGIFGTTLIYTRAIAKTKLVN